MRYTKVLLLVIVSLSFSNPLKGLYVSYDVSNEATIEVLGIEVSNDFSGGLTVGYDYSIAGAVHVGASYDVRRSAHQPSLHRTGNTADRQIFAHNHATGRPIGAMPTL